MECLGGGEGGREPLADDLEDLGGLAHAARRVHVRELALAALREEGEYLRGSSPCEAPVKCFGLVLLFDHK